MASHRTADSHVAPSSHGTIPFSLGMVLVTMGVVYGDIGTIASVIDYPAQPLFQIMNNGVEILVPVIDQVIKKVDRESKTIFITAPTGLIDLYMQK